MRSVVCFRQLKEAALYFDRVLPVAFRRMAGTGEDIVTEFPEAVPSRALINIVFDSSPDSEAERYTQLGRIVHGWDDFAKQIRPYRKTTVRSSADDEYDDLYLAYMRNATVRGTQPVRQHFSAYASSLGIRESAVLLPEDGQASSVDGDDPVARLAGVGLIDTTDATWEQIIEIRLDAEARRKLQRLRSFLTDTYAGRSREFVEDDLARRLEEYDQARRKHGFDIVTGSISALLDSQNLQAAACTGIATALLGGPWVGASSAAVVELGKVAIEFAKRRRAMVDWRANHQLAYVVELKSLNSKA